jgi:hypothetical protein
MDKMAHKNDIILLATTIVYKDVSRTSLKQSGVIKLLHFAAAELKKNPKLKINFKKENSEASSKTRTSTATLLDLYAEHAAEYNYTKSFIKGSDKPILGSIQEILSELIDKANTNHIHLLKNNALSGAIENFLRNFLNASGIIYNNIKDLISSSKKLQAFFVAPQELYNPETKKICIGNY